jgi:hypothetical protein
MRMLYNVIFHSIQCVVRICLSVCNNYRRLGIVFEIAFTVASLWSNDVLSII